MLEYSFPRLLVPWNIRSHDGTFRERKFQGMNGPGSECSRERMFPGTKVPGNEWSWERKFHHGNECSRERIVLWTNIPDTNNFIYFNKVVIWTPYFGWTRRLNYTVSHTSSFHSNFVIECVVVRHILRIWPNVLHIWPIMQA